ncbi:MAG: ZIP family metal transporter [Candidatus Thorarchaeota archaeon]
MANELLAFGAILVVSLVSLVGLFTLSMKTTTVHRLIFIMVAFGAGAILGAALFGIIPEIIDEANHNAEDGNGHAAETEDLRRLLFALIAFGFIAFYGLERFLYWYHGHHSCEEVEKGCEDAGRHTQIENYAYLNLVGDGIHNMMDGAFIIVAFGLDLSIGLAATLAVLAHELPQEIGDFGILLHAGMSRSQALVANFMSGLTALIGGFLALWLVGIADFDLYILAFAAGGLIYLGAAELVPEMQKEQNNRKALIQLVMFAIGMFSMLGVAILTPHSH